MDKKIMKFEEEIKKIDDMVSNVVYDGIVEMSRSRLAKDMEKNTRYFHNIALTRRMNNMIDALEESLMVGFRDGLVDMIAEEDSAALEVLPSIEEYRDVVWDCESSRAPGSDGVEFTVTVLGFFQTSRLPTDSNITWVALAPKFIGVKEIKDLGPISMVGCVYKVIFKVLVRRMRSVMPGLVEETQSAFVKGRKIHDEALIACETVKGVGYRVCRHNFYVNVDKWFTNEAVQDGNRSEIRMIGESVRNGWISPLFIERDNIELSHLQFIDETVLFCLPKEEIIKNYKRLLRCFELMLRYYRQECFQMSMMVGSINEKEVCTLYASHVTNMTTRRISALNLPSLRPSNRIWLLHPAKEGMD
ncbi:uncharacterized protein LOC130945814 [Arachis stenosperma]|uniref:uncharacterized protein LOC130945814 n=1 Tax=Arachis stenosperma TaxID=217475 RepID=UPI0025AD72CB|nr:uncharacterized protein LOC130945814 [Arachis stenosperma]